MKTVVPRIQASESGCSSALPSQLPSQCLLPNIFLLVVGWLAVSSGLGERPLPVYKKDLNSQVPFWVWTSQKHPKVKTTSGNLQAATEIAGRTRGEKGESCSGHQSARTKSESFLPFLLDLLLLLLLDLHLSWLFSPPDPLPLLPRTDAMPVGRLREEPVLIQFRLSYSCCGGCCGEYFWLSKSSSRLTF